METRGEGRPLAVLVADDDAISRMVVAGLVRRAGHDADTAIDGLEAVEAAARRRYDLVLMDLQMPELDGVEAARRIRAAGGDAPRIVALTATVDEEARRRCAEAGIDAVALKPLDAARLEEIFSGIAPRSAPAESVPGATAGDLDVATFARFRREAAVHLARPVDEIVGGFLATLRERFDDLRRAAGTEDREAVAAHAHAIRGGAATIGAAHLARLMSELERDARRLSRERLTERAAAGAESFSRAERCVRDELARAS